MEKGVDGIHISPLCVRITQLIANNESRPPPLLFDFTPSRYAQGGSPFEAFDAIVSSNGSKFPIISTTYVVPSTVPSSGTNAAETTSITD